MKTLDEVIDSIDRLSAILISNEALKDALLYLREYRSDKLQWEANQKAYDDAIQKTKKARERYIALVKSTKDELAALRDFWAEQQAKSERIKERCGSCIHQDECDDFDKAVTVCEEWEEKQSRQCE